MELEEGCECQLCGARRGVVFCGAHAARLCLQCDQALHQCGRDHPRAALCDSCNAAAGELRLHCAIVTDPGGVTLCRPCAYPYARTDNTTAYTYTGCPAPLEMMRLLSTDQLLFLPHHAAPPPPELVFPGPAVGSIMLEDDAAAAARITHHMQPQPKPATCRLQQEQAPTLFSAAAAAAAAEATRTTECSPPPPPPPAAVQDQSALIMMIRNIHKWEERNRAKLRYNDKKKRRKFSKHVMYACRKAGADTRKRVKGRFAKASSSSSSSSIDHRL